MKRLILALAMLVMIAGPIKAAEDDGVMLHCAGDQNGGTLNHYYASENILIAKDLSWMSLWDAAQFKWSRQDTYHQTNGTWWYETDDGDKSTGYIFNPQRLTLLVSSDNRVLDLNCFPITNPFTQ